MCTEAGSFLPSTPWLYLPPLSPPLSSKVIEESIYPPARALDYTPVRFSYSTSFTPVRWLFSPSSSATHTTRTPGSLSGASWPALARVVVVARCGNVNTSSPPPHPNHARKRVRGTCLLTPPLGRLGWPGWVGGTREGGGRSGRCMHIRPYASACTSAPLDV